MLQEVFIDFSTGTNDAFGRCQSGVVEGGKGVKFSDGEVVASGQNSYVMANMSFQALGDAVAGHTMKITRAVA